MPTCVTAFKATIVAQSSRRKASPVCRASSPSSTPHCSRRNAITHLTAFTAVAGLAPCLAPPAFADGDDDKPALCDAACNGALATAEKVTTPSGLQFQDIVVGAGPSPPVGFQVVVNYIAMTPDGRVFDSSLERGSPYYIRVGAGQVVAGLDEGLRTMRVGGVRRLYVPGALSFPKGLPAGPGRPRVPPSSPVMFDVQLLLVPGLDAEE